MDKTRKSTSKKLWPYSTCAISVWRTGKILLVVDFLVLSTTDSVQQKNFFNDCISSSPTRQCIKYQRHLENMRSKNQPSLRHPPTHPPTYPHTHAHTHTHTLTLERTFIVIIQKTYMVSHKT